MSPPTDRPQTPETSPLPVGTVFISHASADKNLVDQLAADLKARGIPVWYDKLDLRIGDSIPAAINEGLGRAKYFLILLSPSSVASRWVAEELNAAMMEQVARGGTFLLPAMVADCDVPILLRHRRHVDFRRSYDDGLSELLSLWDRDHEATTDVPNQPLYPWPDVEANDEEFVYLASERFDKFFRMGCDLSKTAGWHIDYIVQTLRLPWNMAVSELGMKWSFRYRLIFNNKGIGLSTALRDASVFSGAVLKLGINGTYEDVWTKELDAMWDGTKIYEASGAIRREAELREQIRVRGPLTRDRLRVLANDCFVHV